jgi:hypothetical protein
VRRSGERAAARLTVALASSVVSACAPDLGPAASVITDMRVLAVRGNPAEVAPGGTVAYDALVASPSGTASAARFDWAFCTSPRPLDTDDPVSTACLGAGVAPIGGPSATASAVTPMNACSLFGPDTPPGNFRPADADGTGGFYQPVRADLGALVAFRLERITCDLPDAPIAAAIQLAQHYLPNQNPRLDALTFSLAGTLVAPDAIPAGAAVTLATGWSASDAESYLWFDPATQTVVTRREALQVSWFATSGALADEITGRGEADPATTTSTTWTAPSAPGAAHLWLVLRDSRGGIDFAAYDVAVR